MITNKRQSTGRQGEDIAAAYLQQAGFLLVARNWRCRYGELDLVMQADAMLVFVEVKTRRSAGNAFSGITPRKRERLLAAVHTYLSEHAAEEPPWRVDALAVILPPTGQPIIEHVEDVLDW